MQGSYVNEARKQVCQRHGRMLARSYDGDDDDDDGVNDEE